MHVLLDSECDNDRNITRSYQRLDADCDTEIKVNGTIWKEMKVGESTGKSLIHTIFKDTAVPTGYAERNVMPGSLSNPRLDNRQNCASQALCDLNYDLSILITKLLLLQFCTLGEHISKIAESFLLLKSKSWSFPSLPKF